MCCVYVHVCLVTLEIAMLGSLCGCTFLGWMLVDLEKMMEGGQNGIPMTLRDQTCEFQEKGSKL